MTIQHAQFIVHHIHEIIIFFTWWIPLLIFQLRARYGCRAGWTTEHRGTRQKGRGARLTPSCAAIGVAIADAADIPRQQHQRSHQHHLAVIGILSGSICVDLVMFP